MEGSQGGSKRRNQEVRFVDARLDILSQHCSWAEDCLAEDVVQIGNTVRSLRLQHLESERER